jgi:hypothetical protein
VAAYSNACDCRPLLFVAGFVRSKESQRKFNLQRVIGIEAQFAQVKIETGNDFGASTSRRYQPKQFKPTQTFIEESPLGDPAAAPVDPQISRACVPGVAKTHLQKIHDSIQSIGEISKTVEAGSFGRTALECKCKI